MRYWLLFCDSQEKHLRWYRAGYRHMWIVAMNADRWVAIDPLAASLDITMFNQPVSLDAVRAYWDRLDYKYLEVEPGNIGYMPKIPELLTCVTIAKRFLGLDKPFIQTPHQLYRYLTRKRKHL